MYTCPTCTRHDIVREFAAEVRGFESAGGVVLGLGREVAHSHTPAHIGLFV